MVMPQEREPTQAERELLDTLHRAARSRAGRSAVHLHLSRLLPANRTLARLKIAARFFAPLELAYEMKVFPLAAGDIIIIGKDMPEDDIARLISRLKSLFSTDPLVMGREGERFGARFDKKMHNDRFATWYALETEVEELTGIAERLLHDAEALLKAHRAAPKPPAPVGPGDLDGIVARLGTVALAPMIRRQACLRFVASDVADSPDAFAEILFEEFFVSMADVQQAAAAGLDLTADRWLFQYFTRAVDEAILYALPGTEAFQKPERLSLNLNIESINSASFKGLVSELAPEQRLIAEVPLIDVVTNLQGYYRARDLLHEGGHSLLIDGLAPSNLSSLDFRLLNPDFVKVMWSADLAASAASGVAPLQASLGELDISRVILARAGSEAAIRWGRNQGISAFQGVWTDAALGTVTLIRCPASSQCTLKQCVQRRAGVTNRRRHECPNPPGLDMVQRFAAPSQKKMRAAEAVSGQGAS